IPYWATQIFLWDGATVRHLGGATDLAAPWLNDRDQVVWWVTEPNLQLEFWDGSQIRQLPYHLKPAITAVSLAASINNAGQVAWQSWDGNNWQIYHWSDGAIQQLTTVQQDNYLPYLNDAGQITWLAGEEDAVYLYTPGGM